MYRAVRKFIISHSERAYHSSSKKDALKVLKSLESVNGKTDGKLIKLSDEYASDILGWKGYAPWLYVYSAMNNTFKQGWIPKNYYGKVVVPKLKGNYGLIGDYNALTSRLFTSSCFPVRVYYTNGLWMSPQYQVLSDNEVMDIVTEGSDKFVYKTDKSIRGLGVYIIEKNKLNLKKLKELGNGVLQEYIHQHSFFQDIIQSSVATLRITSVINDEGVISVRACYLRVGRSSDTHVKSMSHIRVPVSITTGALDTFGYTTDWIPIEKHPDTNYIFKNKQVPNFNKCIETVLDLHKRIPFARTVGWDVIIDINEKVQVMEWNGSHNDIKFSEATQGPCFSDLGWEKLRIKTE